MTRHSSAGFTLIELLVAASLASIGFLGLAALHAQSLRASAVSRNTSIATTLASQQIEALRRTPAQSLTDVAPHTVTVGSRGYTRSANIANAPVGDGKKVTVNMSWSDEFGAHTFQLVSVIGQ